MNDADLLHSMQRAKAALPPAPAAAELAMCDGTLHAARILMERPPAPTVETFLGIAIVISDTIPPGEAHLRDSRTGKLLSRITGIGQ